MGGHADPEEMETSSEPKTQRKKRRIDSKQADRTDEDANRGKGREEVKPDEAIAVSPIDETPINETPINETPTSETTTNENPTNETHINENQIEATIMAQEIEILKEQHRLQLEEYHLMAESI